VTSQKSTDYLNYLFPILFFSHIRPGKSTPELQSCDSLQLLLYSFFIFLLGSFFWVDLPVNSISVGKSVSCRQRNGAEEFCSALLFFFTSISDAALTPCHFSVPSSFFSLILSPQYFATRMTEKTARFLFLSFFFSSSGSLIGLICHL